MASPISRINLAATKYPTNTAPVTKDARTVNAASAIRGISSNLSTLEVPLKEAMEIMLNPADSSQAKKARAVKALKEANNLIINSAKHLLENVKILDPIPSLDYVHARTKHSPLQDITNIKRNSSSQVNGPSKRRKTNSPVLPEYNLPFPQNGKQFSKLEVVDILSRGTWPKRSQTQCSPDQNDWSTIGSS